METIRYLNEIIKDECLRHDKMAFISGPRQVGKTTLSKSLAHNYKVSRYENWDDLAFRKIWAASRNTLLEINSANKYLLILDELHKAKSWKRDLKGLYDLKPKNLYFIVTGSARLNVFKKGSDSLLGRYFSFRLHPFSVGEILHPKNRITPDDFIKSLSTIQESSNNNSSDIFKKLLTFGGFPDPYLKGSANFHRLWIKGRIDKLVREDLRDLSRIQELSQIEMLVALLPERVGSLLSLAPIRRDLEVAHLTVKRWLNYLSELYYFYEIKPYSKSIPRSLKKEGKIYLWDWSELENEGSRYENLVASHLLKSCHYWTDSGEGQFDLHFLRNKQKQEVDFLIVRDKKPWISLEVKSGQTSFEKSILKYHPFLKHSLHIQLCKEKNYVRTFKEGELTVLIVSVDLFLSLLV
jgi:predicted AAA+ superfamily ATPase